MNKLICKIFGHKYRQKEKPIVHRTKSSACVMQSLDYSCNRCGKEIGLLESFDPGIRRR